MAKASKLEIGALSAACFGLAALIALAAVLSRDSCSGERPRSPMPAFGFGAGPVMIDSVDR